MLADQPNNPPNAQAGADQLVNEAATVVLDGSDSSDSDGSISSFTWSQTGGATVQLQNANTSIATFTAPTVTDRELLTFELTVTDNDNSGSTDNVDVTINADPTSDAGADQLVAPSVVTTLDGSASSDTDGSVDIYSWSQVSGIPIQLADTDSVQIQFQAPNVTTTHVLVFDLIVTDDNGASAVDAVTVFVRPLGSIGQQVTVWNDNLIIYELDPAELVPGNLMDLAGKTFRFTPEGSAYRLESIPFQWETEFGSPITASEIALSGFQFPFSGVNWDSLFINSTGSITFGSDDTGFYDGARDRFLLFRTFGASMVDTIPIISPLFRVFVSIQGAADRFVRILSDRIIITWEVTENYRNELAFIRDPQPNRFQVILYESGQIEFSYETISVQDGIVGVFPIITSQQTLVVISDPVDAALPSHIDTTSVTASLVGNASLQFEFSARGNILPEGNPSLDSLFYRVWIDLDEPFVQSVDFNDPDIVWEIGTTGLAYEASGPGVSPVVQISGNTISLQGAVDALGVDRFAFFTDTVDFDEPGTPFDQTDPITVDLPPGLSPQVDISASTATDSAREVIYEAFHYPDIPEVQALTCGVIQELGDAFDFLSFYPDFRIDRQEAGAVSTGPVGNKVTGVIRDGSDPAAYCSAGTFQAAQHPAWIGPPIFSLEGVGTGAGFDDYRQHIDLLAHEIGHRWLTTQFVIVGGQTIRIGTIHWLPGLHTPVAFPVQPNQTTTGNYWQDNGDGTFTILSTHDDHTGFTHLDLYLMGFLREQDVPDFFFIQNLNSVGDDGSGNQVWSGNRLDLTIADHLAFHGPRLPAYDSAQKVFNSGFVGIVQDQQLPSLLQIERLEGARLKWIEFWPAATGSEATMTSSPPTP